MNATSQRSAIWVNGTPPPGVADLAGDLLDGNHDGKPGGDYLAIIPAAGIPAPPVVPTPVPVASGFGPSRDAFVTALYRELLGRSPEPSGLRFWAARLAAGVSPMSVARAIATSTERLQREFYSQIWKDLHQRGLVNTDSLGGLMSGEGAVAKCTNALRDHFLRFIADASRRVE